MHNSTSALYKGQYHTLLLHFPSIQKLNLDEVFQNAIQDATLSFVIINNPTDDQVCDYFYLLNNGKPLSAMTKTRVKAVSRETITKLGNHELFKNALTAKALARYTNEDIVVKAWAVLNQEEPSLETAKIRKVTENIKITNDDVIQLTNCFDRILEVHKMIEDKKIAKRILTRTHMISIMRVVNRSVDDGVSGTTFDRPQFNRLIVDIEARQNKYGSN